MAVICLRRCLVLAALSSQAWPLAAPAPGPENEVSPGPGNTVRLPEGRVTPIHLPAGRPRRMYFSVKEGTSPMSVTVIPCDVPIQWSLAARTQKDKPSKKVQWSTKKSTPEVWQKRFRRNTQMYSYTGNATDTYTGPAYSRHSTYVLKLQSREKDTRASAYLQVGRGLFEVLPELPADSRVHFVGVGMTSVTVGWVPSPSVAKDNRSYGYCVLVNCRRNYRGPCAAQEEGPLTEPCPTLRGEPSEGDSSGLRCACRGPENVCTVSELAPGKLYYFDVLVISGQRGPSAAYTGASVRTQEGAAMPLRDSELRWVALQGPGSQGAQLYSFRPHGWQQSALLTLQSCGPGRVRLKVSGGGHILASRVVAQGLTQLWLNGSPSYHIHLENAAPTTPGRGVPENMVKIQASSAYHRQAAPALPSRLKIRAFDKLRNCRSVTVAWHGTEERNLYCVYRRKLGDGDPAGDGRCLGPESRNDTERALCKYFQDLHPRKTVATATVGGLEPGTAYLLDVYMMRHQGIPVKYHSKTVHTKKEC